MLAQKVEDEVRDAVVEKLKDTSLVTMALSQTLKNGVRKKLAYEIQKMHEASTTLFSLRQTHSVGK